MIQLDHLRISELYVYASCSGQFSREKMNSLPQFIASSEYGPFQPLAPVYNSTKRHYQQRRYVVCNAFAYVFLNIRLLNIRLI